jgi:hypothetical protein
MVQTSSSPINLSGTDLKKKSVAGSASSSKSASWIVEKLGPKAANFEIPEELAQKNLHLVELILNTESMNDEEREYWFAILPIMNDEQIAKFQGILQNERDQLDALDKKYQAEVSALNKKHSGEYMKKSLQEKQAKIRQAEAAESAEEKKKEEELMKRLAKL